QILIDRLQSVEEHEPSVVRALAVSVPARFEVIIDNLTASDDELSLKLTNILSRMGNRKAAEVLVQALWLDNPAARKAAATSLSGMDRPEARIALRKAAKDPDPDVRAICQIALGDRK
ncbi:MAG: HEAT repeat domain-containing protein, partial [Myxococcota bacterium]